LPDPRELDVLDRYEGDLPIAAWLRGLSAPRTPTQLADLDLRPVERAADLRELVRDGGDDVDRAGRLRDDVVEALTCSGLYHLYWPAERGGPGANPLVAMLAIEQLAMADGSAAWCAHVSTQVSGLLDWIDDPTAAAVEGGGDRPRVRLSGSTRPLGQARRDGDGYRVSGHWDFCSNSLHATWFVGACRVEGEGPSVIGTMLIPIETGTITGGWDVVGLRGTGSHDFEVEDLWVPLDRMGLPDAPTLHGVRPSRSWAVISGMAPTVGVALGLAAGAVVSFAEMSHEATTRDGELRLRSAVHLAVGEAATAIAAARTYCVTSLLELLDASDGDLRTVLPPDDPALVNARLAMVNAMTEAGRAVRMLFDVGGTRSIFASRRIERQFRDVQVALRHHAASSAHVATAGRVLLGLPAESLQWS